MTPRSDPPGTTPWDRWHGARIGGLVGVIVSAVVVAAIDASLFWLVLVVGVLGAAAGYWIERRRSL